MAPKKKEKTIEDTYQKKSQLEHVLHRPGMYIGDIDFVTAERWIIENDTNSLNSKGTFVRKNVSYSPGLYKIFDEIFTNATDHSQRDQTMKKIEVTFSDDGEISIFNDGEGIPIEIHKELGKYVPEIIFGEFHTSSNYDDTEARTVGGLNGYGSKLTNAFSLKFTVEICDGASHYIQTWKNNMSEKSEPIIKKSKKLSFTKISFIPDYQRFGMKTLDTDTRSLFLSRVYEGSAITNKNVSIYFDSQKIGIKNFEEFVNLFIGKNPRVYIQLNDRWEIAVVLNPYDKF